MKLTFACTFSFEEDSWSTLEREDHYLIAKPLAAHLWAVTLSVSRGVLFARTEGTMWQFQHIPLHDVNALVKEDIAVAKPTSTPEPQP